MCTLTFSLTRQGWPLCRPVTCQTIKTPTLSAQWRKITDLPACAFHDLHLRVRAASALSLLAHAPPLQADLYIGKTKVQPSSGRVEVQFSNDFFSGKIALLFDERENLDCHSAVVWLITEHAHNSLLQPDPSLSKSSRNQRAMQSTGLSTE